MHGLASSLVTNGSLSLIIVLIVLPSVIASGHAIIYKRDSRGAVLWVGIIWFMPLLGPLLYFGFGINRIKRRAVLLRQSLERYRAAPSVDPGVPEDHLPEGAGHLHALARVVHTVTSRPLLPGNRIEALVNGDAAYPAMLAAIARARHSIALSTYIFNRDRAGTEFVAALGDAVGRGVAVRVLIDATGTFFSWQPVLAALRRVHVPCARFLPAFSLLHPVSLNLRNHRKLLVVDGRLGFTGGLNICDGHWLQRAPRTPVADHHFQVTGPVVAHLQEAFCDDWLFTTGEALRGGAWFPPLEPEGDVAARGIADGPDEDFEKIRWTLLAALTAARHSVQIVTPYFLPDTALISALNLAAMRGVQVDILLPLKGDLPFVQWASAAHWWQMLEHGCRIWISPPPFDHSKLFIVDRCWVLCGSANWDPRSLRLNFEFDLECYDATFARELADRFEANLGRAHRITEAEANARGLMVRLRDGIARLFTPFM
ncbi:phospholipase D-like domain-containing protein [Horticoccus sp. 23ND18S-11]|uniref:phospholipase D-like domain-containing protein n=1 Tax=Horticoccus sp. 23ND18S-11 TaxID=3391832 RepID=UPI0039C9C24C